MSAAQALTTGRGGQRVVSNTKIPCPAVRLRVAQEGELDARLRRRYHQCSRGTAHIMCGAYTRLSESSGRCPQTQASRASTGSAKRRYHSSSAPPLQRSRTLSLSFRTQPPSFSPLARAPFRRVPPRSANRATAGRGDHQATAGRKDHRTTVGRTERSGVVRRRASTPRVGPET